MAVDDVSLNASKPEGSPDSVDLRSARNSAEIETPPSTSRASSLLTDITECSSGSSSSSSVAPTSRIPYQQQQQQQQQPPQRGKHLYKSTSSFHLSGGRVHPPSNGCQACCQLARFPQHPYHPYNHNTLAGSRHPRQMQTPHLCSQSAAFKMGHPPFGGVSGQNGCGHQFAPAPSQQSQMMVQQHLRHQSSTASLNGQSQFGNPPRSSSPVAIGGCLCCPFCCQCDQRLYRKQSQVSHLYGSYEGLMGSVPHPMEPISHHGHGSAPLTAEGLSWRRLHMSRAKLKATATTSELLSGFAMVAMVELQINEPTNVPEWLFVLFAVCTTILVSVHIFALMISTYILPNVDAVSKMQHSASGGNEGNTHLSHRRNASHSSSISFTSGVDPAVLESPHERMRGFIEIAWAFSTVLGLFLFLVELGILCWVKFWDHSFIAAWAATAIVIPVLVLFVVFATHFYRSLVAIKCDTSASDMRDLEKMKADLDAASRDAAAASNV